MAKVAKESMTLISSLGTGYFYVNRKNKKKAKGEGKLKLKKYDPVVRKHVLFEEKKLAKLKSKYKPGSDSGQKSDNGQAKSEKSVKEGKKTKQSSETKD